MSEHMSPIPSMIYNAAVGGHVTNSQQIIDEDYNLEQKDINKETLGVPYNASNPNGMGKIVLKKNDNFKQVVEAQTNGNTIFVIKYDFTLTGDVRVPANCVLEFDGGSLSGNNVITFLYTQLEGNVKILSDFTGTVNNSIVDITWFGCEASKNGSQVSDCSAILNKIVSIAKDSPFDIYIPSGSFRVDNTIHLKSGTNFVGYHGYSFNNKSTLYTTIQTDDFIMFEGTSTDSIRHCKFENITFSRNRTAEERNAISIGTMTGCGYGLAGTCFDSITEGNFIKCGFIGWGACFKGSQSIIFMEGTDFSYCNNIVNVTDLLSCFKISHANGWCLGNIFDLKVGIQDLTIESSWFEYFVSIIKTTSTKRIINFSVVSSTMTNAEYGETLFNIIGSDWNRIYINVLNSVLKVKTIIGNDIGFTDNILCFENSQVVYQNDFDETAEGAVIYGNARFYDKGTIEREFSYPKKKGINYNTGVAEVPIILKEVSSWGDVNKGIQRYRNYLFYKDVDNINRIGVPPIFLTSGGGMPKDANNQELGGPYFVFNSIAHSPGDVILKFKTNWDSVVNLKRFGMSGSTRPSDMSNGDIGMIFMETSNGVTKPIFYAGKNGSTDVWVDATGTPV